MYKKYTIFAIKTMTQFRTIPGFSMYQVNELGEIFSLNYKRTGNKKLLKPAVSKDGYPQTMLLSDSGKYQSKKVHWFMTISFFGERGKGQEVNHKDGNKQNNRIDNLEYCTRSENIIHSYRMGLQIPMDGSKNPNSKLTEQQVKEIREHAGNSISRYYGRKELAKKYGVSECSIKEIVNRRKNLWKSV